MFSAIGPSGCTLSCQATMPSLRLKMAVVGTGGACSRGARGLWQAVDPLPGVRASSPVSHGEPCLGPGRGFDEIRTVVGGAVHLARDLDERPGVGVGWPKHFPQAFGIVVSGSSQAA